MKLKFNIAQSTFNYLVVGLSLFVLFVAVVGVNYSLIRSDFEKVNERNNKVYNSLKEKSAFLSLKSSVDKLIIDIDASTTHVLTNLRDRELNITEAELKNPWREKIGPQLKNLDQQIASYSDEIRSDYNKISDIIDKIKEAQEDFLSGDKEEVSYSSNFAQNVSDLHVLTTELNAASNEFLENYIAQRTQGFIAAGDEELHSINIFISTLLISIGILVLLYISSKKTKLPFRKLERVLYQIGKGNLPEKIGLNNKDYAVISEQLGKINALLIQIKEYARLVSKAEYDNSASFDNNGELGEALNEMKYSLSKLAKEDAQRSHINIGLAKFSEILGDNTNNLEKFGDNVLLNLVSFLNANQGALYVINDEEDVETLELSSCYAYEKKKYLNQKIKKGQGLVGQCWLERKSIYMTQVPDDYVKITSGLGYSTPRCILIVPLVFNEKIQGIIELASFKPFEDYELNFVEKVIQSIASALASVKINTQTQFLLSQSERLTKQMKRQEEEMVKNVEELKMTQEESQRREEEHLREISRLRKRLEEYERNF